MKKHDAILHIMLNLGFWNLNLFFTEITFMDCNAVSLVLIAISVWYLHFKHISLLDFKLLSFYLTFGDKSIRVLGLHIWNNLPKSLKVKWSFQTSKRYLDVKDI